MVEYSEAILSMNKIAPLCTPHPVFSLKPSGRILPWKPTHTLHIFCMAPPNLPILIYFYRVIPFSLAEGSLSAETTLLSTGGILDIFTHSSWQIISAY